MPNLVKEFNVEIGFLLGGGDESSSPRATGTQNYPAEDRVKHICMEMRRGCHTVRELTIQNENNGNLHWIFHAQTQSFKRIRRPRTFVGTWMTEIHQSDWSVAMV